MTDLLPKTARAIDRARRHDAAKTADTRSLVAIEEDVEAIREHTASLAALASGDLRGGDVRVSRVVVPLLVSGVCVAGSAGLAALSAPGPFSLLVGHEAATSGCEATVHFERLADSEVVGACFRVYDACAIDLDDPSAPVLLDKCPTE